MRTIHVVTVEFASGKNPDHRSFIFANTKQRDEFVEYAKEAGFAVVKIETDHMETAKEAILDLLSERAYEQTENEDKRCH